MDSEFEESHSDNTSSSEYSEDREAAFDTNREELPKFEEIVPGLHFLTFRPDKIKFYFIPSEITKYVDRKIKYYFSLRYRNNKYWQLARHSVPVNKKLNVYRLFVNKDVDVTDSNVMEFIIRLHKILGDWCAEQEEYRLEKFRRYKIGELDWMELDEDDEDFFLSETEKIELYQKKIRILKRMIPPTANITRRRRYAR